MSKKYTYYCLGCDQPFELDVDLRCCDGRMCGCMGMPTEPPICSAKCYDLWQKKKNIKKDYPEQICATKNCNNLAWLEEDKVYGYEQHDLCYECYCAKEIDDMCK